MGERSGLMRAGREVSAEGRDPRGLGVCECRCACVRACERKHGNRVKKLVRQRGLEIRLFCKY